MRFPPLRAAEKENFMYTVVSPFSAIPALTLREMRISFMQFTKSAIIMKGMCEE